MTLEELEAAILKIPEEQRVFLAERLLASLSDGDEPEEDAIVAEAERRLQEFDAGAATILDGPDVLARLSSRLKNEV